MIDYVYLYADMEPAATYNIGQGQTLVIEFALLPNSRIILTTAHTGLAQDFSVRFSFSREPGGMSVGGTRPIHSFWDPCRIATYKVSLDATSSPVLYSNNLPVYTNLVEPGIYYLNVQNLVNAKNDFYMEVEEIVDILPVE